MPDLSITRIDVFQKDLPYSGGVYRLSGGREYRQFDATFVRITIQNGLEERAISVILLRFLENPLLMRLVLLLHLRIDSLGNSFWLMLIADLMWKRLCVC